MLKLLITVLTLFSWNYADAHRGRTNSEGCHNCRTGSCAGTYHCHNSGSSSRSTIRNNVAPKPVRKPDEEVRRTQNLLNQLGYEAGPADGFRGRKTNAAIKQYLSDYGYAGEIRLITHLESDLAEKNKPKPQVAESKLSPMPEKTAVVTGNVTKQVRAEIADSPQQEESDDDGGSLGLLLLLMSMFYGGRSLMSKVK